MIIDSNVALGWVLPQAHSRNALLLASRTDLSAPNHLLVEAAHVLTRAVRRKTLSETQARNGMSILTAAQVRWTPALDLLADAVDLSIALNAVVHDCLYLALALRDGDELVTADQRFFNAVTAQPAYARRIRLL